LNEKKELIIIQIFFFTFNQNKTQSFLLELALFNSFKSLDISRSYRRHEMKTEHCYINDERKDKW